VTEVQSYIVAKLNFGNPGYRVFWLFIIRPVF